MSSTPVPETTAAAAAAAPLAPAADSTTTTPADATTAASTTGSGVSTTSSTTNTEEDNLRKQLRSILQSVNRREPLEPTYKMLLENSTLTRRPVSLKTNKFYKKIGSRLRERVELYQRHNQGKDPFDKISQRKPMDEASMRAAFTLREYKDYEQIPLLETTLIATSMHPERKRSLDGMALGLQQVHSIKKQRSISPVPGGVSSGGGGGGDQSEIAKLDLQRQQARQWEEARRKREVEERREREEELLEERRKKQDTSSGLQKTIEKVFKKLWDMEFPNLGNTNPFRIVIDRESAQYIAPDYFNVIATPMNLTYIGDKVKKNQYATLPQFFGDVDLMINNALKYNAEEGNPYRIAAQELKKKHDKIVKKIYEVYSSNKK